MAKLNFKMGSESSFISTIKGKSKMKDGEVYFTSDGTFGKIWYKNGTKELNVVPDIVDCGEISWGSTICCFVPGSQVLIDLNGNTKNIEEIKKGDIVISYDIFKDIFYEVEVQNLIINNHTINMAEIFFDNGNTLIMNAYHPLYTKTGFHSLTNHEGYATLVIGDEVKTNDGWSEILNIRRFTVDTPMTTYNLATKNFDEIIDDDTNDTYIVNGFVVHNAGCPT